jgi:hypothetical protein
MSINDSDRFYVSVTSSEDLILYFGDLRLMVMFCSAYVFWSMHCPIPPRPSGGIVDESSKLEDLHFSELTSATLQR